MQTISAVELAYRVSLHISNGKWVALIAPADRTDVAAAELRTALEEASEGSVMETNALKGPLALCMQLLKTGDSVSVVVGLNDWTIENWRQLDGNRSRFERKAATILILSEVAAAALEANAPNFSSWLGGDMWMWSPNTDSLSPAEVEERLISLRRWAGKSDHEILDLAESRRLVLGPQHVEWLVLLGRGDLIA